MKLVKIVNFLNLGMNHNRIISKKNPDVVASKIYFSDDLSIQIHQSRVQICFLLVWNQANKTNNPTKKTIKNLQEVLSPKSADAIIDHDESPPSQQESKSPESTDCCPYFLWSRKKVLTLGPSFLMGKMM